MRAYLWKTWKVDTGRACLWPDMRSSAKLLKTLKIPPTPSTGLYQTLRKLLIPNGLYQTLRKLLIPNGLIPNVA